MGLPPQAFKSEYYRSWRKWSSDNAQQQASPRPGSARSDREDTPSSVSEKAQTPAEVKQQRRLSTGTLGLMSSAEMVRKAAGEVLENALQTPVGSPKPAPSPATDAKCQPRRGRRGRGNSTASQKGSSTARSASAGSAVDKEERMRRRQLILAARPGGTGMVTLPDGTKVRARRVDDAAQEGDDGYSQEWGFAGLAKAQKIEPAEDAAQDDTEVETNATEVGDEEEARPPRTASPTGAEALSDVTPRNASPTGQDRGAETKLSLQERVRRRHEAEVAALGAEVLAAHRRKVGAAKESAAAAAASEAATVPTVPAAGTSESAIAPRPPTEAKKEADKVQERPGATIRKESAPSSKSARPPLANIFQRRPSRSTSPQAAAASSEATSRTSHSPDAHELRAETQGRSRSKASNASSDHRRSSMDGRSVDYTTPRYSPMRSLPRKPDAKGYAVVPLPSQLGVRPERPREGRVWEWSDDESSLSSEAEEATPTAEGGDEMEGVGDAGDLDEDETTNMDLNEEEMAEEEQRKAAHAKRATTTAAGLERMLVRTKSGVTSTSLAATTARGLPAPQRTRTLDDGSPALTNLDQASTARRITSAGPATSPSQSRSASMSAQPSGAVMSEPAKRDSSRMRNKDSSPSLSSAPRARSRVRDGAAAQADSSSTEDDLMWSRSVPDALGMGLSLSPTVSRTSQTGSVRSSLQPTSPPLQGPSAYFGSKTSSEQQDRRRSMRKPSTEVARSKERSAKKQAERDDDAMDYGWPSSLKGSLYDR